MDEFDRIIRRNYTPREIELAEKAAYENATVAPFVQESMKRRGIGGHRRPYEREDEDDGA